MTSRMRRTAAVLTATTLAVAALATVRISPAVAADPCGAGGNKVACENTKPGAPWEEWETSGGAGDPSIQGFATEISVNLGERIDFKVDTDAAAYTLDIYRSGYYQGHGARKIASLAPSASLPQVQPNCINDAATGLYDCGNWAVSASWTVPTTAVSGVYFARLHRADTDGSSHITFVVRDDASTSEVLFQTSDTTWQAYNTYGGSNFYQGSPAGRAYKISYNRPVLTRGHASGRDFFFSNEYPMIRFLEKNGYDVSYLAGVDTDRRGQLLTNHKVFLSVGHDEYWSGRQRANVEAARDAGVNLMFLSGNEMYWRTRFEPSADASRTPYRTLVSYKETWSNAKVDPAPEWTGTWRDPRFASTQQGAGRPENGLTGTLYMVNNDDLPLTVSAEEGKLRIWRNTSLANIPAGASRELAPHTVGYESNEDLDNGARPPGLIRLSTTKGPTPQYLQDFGNTVAPGTTTHHTTMYRAPSGALVFSAGTVQWAWGLDADHDSVYGREPADPRMQQAQVNLLADMGAQPTTLVPELAPAVASSDTAGPATAITSPAADSQQPNGSTVQVSGTATDAQGRVAGVEVSTDGGASWHPAQGTTAWTYSYVQRGSATASIRARAIDDSANIGAAAVLSVTTSCPCGVFGAEETPAVPSASDGAAVELGLQFVPKVEGFVKGVQFYKGEGNGGTHVGSLWDASGARLASATFTGETATGWQSVRFSNPVAVSPGERYVVSYTAPQGRYAVQVDAFTALGVDADPLTVQGGYGVPPAGVFANPGQYPSLSYRNSNYFVDAIFTLVDDTPPSVVAATPDPGASSIPVGTSVTAKFSKPLTASSVAITLRAPDGSAVPGTTGYDAASRTATFTPAAALSHLTTYAVTVTARDSLGQSLTAGDTWSFETSRPPQVSGVCPCSIFDDTYVPEVKSYSDSLPVTLGMRFVPLVDGTVTGVRFWKGLGDPGTHTGYLWSSDGSQLASGTFTGESTTGWQTLTFTTPVRINKNAEYYAGYHTTGGRYALSPNGFAAADLSRDPLKVFADSGAYTYGGGYPVARAGHNYAVDVVFERIQPTLSLVARRPQPGATGVSAAATAGIWFSSPVSTSVAMSLTRAGSPVAGEVTRGDGGRRLVFVPASPLVPDTEYSVAVTGIVSEEGVQLGDQTWSFRTGSDGSVPQTLLGNTTPQVEAVADAGTIEVGTQFVPSVDGQVTGIRFFKGAGNTGVHTGSLWTWGGQLLATVTFADETPTGWQTAMLDRPVTVTGGIHYVVSYLAPNGSYAATPQYFATAQTSGDLTGPAGTNGRFRYGGGFPTESFNATSYGVDVLFRAGTAVAAEPAPVITLDATTPVAGASQVPRTTTVSATFSAPLAPGWAVRLRAGATPVDGLAQLSADGRTVTFTPSARLAGSTLHTAEVSGIVSTQGATLPTQTWSFTTEAPVIAESSMFTDVAPASPNVASTEAIEVGVKFVPSAAGEVTALKFFKGKNNTGTHTGSLWTVSGTRLAQVTFTDETATGWQQAALSPPVALAAGTTYVASYYAPRGRHARTLDFFVEPWVRGGLTAPSGANGVFLRATGGGFPTSSSRSTNYFVDVVYRTAT